MSETWAETIQCPCGEISVSSSAQTVVNKNIAPADERINFEGTVEWTWSTLYNRCGATTNNSIKSVHSQSKVVWVSGDCNRSEERTSGTFPETETYAYYMNARTDETEVSVYTTDTVYATYSQRNYEPQAGRKYTYRQSTMVDKPYPDFEETTVTTTIEGWDTYSTYTCEKLIVSDSTTTTDTANPITHTRCPPVTTEYTETLNQVPSVTDLGYVTDCYKLCRNIYNSGDKNLMFVKVREGLGDERMMPLREAIIAQNVPPKSPPIKHCWDTLSATPFLDKHKYLGGGIKGTQNIIENADGTFITRGHTKTHKPFTSSEYPWGGNTISRTLSFIETTTKQTVEAYSSNGETFSLTITGLEQGTTEVPILEDGEIEKTEFNTDDDGRKNTASYSGIDWFNIEASWNTNTIVWEGYRQEFVNISQDEYGNWGYPEDNTKIYTTLWDDIHPNEVNFLNKIENTVPVVVEKTNLNWNNCSGDHNYVDATVNAEILAYTQFKKKPENGYGQFGSQLYQRDYDTDRLLQGQGKCTLFEFFTMAYPAYQDIYAVGTGGMMFAKLNAEFSTTVLGNMSATANSALQRVTAFSIPVTITNANNETSATTQIDVGNTKPSFTTQNSTTTLPYESVEKLKHFHTAMTLVYFSQKEYTATSWESVYLETIDSGYKIIREESSTYTSENYDPEQGNCHKHSFMRREGLQENGVMKVGGVLQDGSPRSYYLLVEDLGLPVIGKVTTYSNNCEGGTFEVTYSRGIHELIGTKVSMIQTDAEINVGALRNKLGEGLTMTPEEYEHLKTV